MTSLQNQLKRLAIPTAEISSQGDVERVSLLFDKKNAQSMNSDTIYSLGINGLDELNSIDPTFHTLFYDQLFSESSKKFERTIQTKEVNKKLDLIIEHFLIKLSPYILMRPAHKCLEWLLYRYHIHAFNLDAIFAAILPYHRSNIFVRIVQLLNISSNNCKWNWISPIQKPGVPLPTSYIVTACNKDSSILHFVCNLVPKSLKILNNAKGIENLMRPFVNFYTSVLLSSIEASSEISNQFLSQLMPFIVKSLKSNLRDYIASAYLIISHICFKTTLTEKVIDPLIEVIVKSLDQHMFKECLATIVVICESQSSVKALSDKSVARLLDEEHFLENLILLHETSQIKRFLDIFLKSVISLSFNSENCDAAKHCELLKDILRSIEMSEKLQNTLLGFIFDQCAKCDFNLNDDLSQLVQACQKKFPKAFDVVVSNKFTSASKETMDAFSKLALSSVSHQTVTGSETSVVLSLSHPEPTIRIAGIKYLETITSKNPKLANEEFVKETVMHRLNTDDNDVVIKEVLKFVGSYPACLFYDEDLACSILSKLVIKQNRGLVKSEEVGSHAMNLLFDNIILAQKNGKTKFLVMAAIVEYICANIVLKSNDNIAGALKLYLSLNAGSYRQSGLIKTISEMMKCISGTFKSSYEFKMLLNGVKDLAALSNMSHHKMVCFTLILKCGIEAVENMDDESSNEVMECALQELSQGLIDHIQIEPEENLDYQKQNVFELHASGLYNDESKQDDKKKLSATCFLSCFHALIAVLPSKCKLVEDIFWCKTDQRNNKLYTETLLALLKIENDFPKTMELSNFMSAVRNLITSFMKLFGSASAFILFTVPLWTAHLEFYPNKSNYLTPSTQAQVFAIAFGLFGSCHREECKSKLLAAIQSDGAVLTSLLLSCCHENKTIRSLATKILNSINKFNKILPDVLDKWIVTMLESVTESSREVVSDKTMLSKCLQQCVGADIKDKKAIGKHILDYFSKEIFCNEDVPTYVKYQFAEQCLENVNLAKISTPLAKEMSMLEKEEFNEVEECYLNALIKKVDPSSLKLKMCHKTFIATMNMERFVKTSLQLTAIGVITKEFFADLSEQDQQDILNELVTLSANSKNHILTNAITKALKAIKIKSEQVLEVLQLVMKTTASDAPSSTVAVKRARYQKSKRKSEANVEVKDNIQVHWKKATVVLEMIQHKKKVKSSEILVRPLFELLGVLLDFQSQEKEIEDGDVDAIEYRKQIILNSLLNICQKLKKSKEINDVLTGENFKVALLVHCIRTSNNLQTQQHALMLLAEATTVCPEDVLHNVMAIFTFVGTHTVRQDNEMSYQVISKTITTILPAMLKNVGKTHATKVSLLKIISVFVNAFPHIPSHRRIPVFDELLKSLGHEEHLWMTIVLLIQQFTNKPVLKAPTDSATATETDEEESRAPAAAASFTMDEAVGNWSLICTLFDTQAQVFCLIKIAQFLINLDADIESKNSRKSFKRKVEVVDVRLHSLKQLRRLKLACLYFISYLLTQNRNKNIFDFKTKDDSDSAAKVTVQFRRLLEVFLAYIDSTSLSMKEMEDHESRDYKFNKVLVHKSYELIEQINMILPTGTFLLTLQGLLQHKVPSTRKRAMEMLSDRINNSADTFKKEEKSVLLKLVKELKKVTDGSDKSIFPKDVTEEQIYELQSTSWNCMKAVVHLCAKQNPDAFVDVFPIISDLLSNYQNTDFQVVVSVLLCLAELSVSLKTHCIPHLPNIMPSLLNLLKKKETLESDNVVFACLAALHRILENLANFISPYLEDVIIRITALKLISRYHEDIAGDKETMISHISIRLQSIFNIVATKLPTRVLLPSLKKCRERILNRRPKCMEYLSEISSSHVTSLKKADINKSVSQLGEFYIECLNYRMDIADSDLNNEDINVIEDAIITSTRAMLLKLPENSFRPLFFKIYNWACLSGTDSIKKLITFYRLNLSLAEKLKGLFAMFSGHLLSNIVEMMKGDKLQEEISENEKYCLLTAVVDVMSTILKYDTSDFMTKERFQLMLVPFVNHLEDLASEQDEDEIIEPFVKDHLVPCFGHLAASCSDESNWKSLNFQVLLKTKSNHPKVQYFALAATEMIAEKLGEDYMLLLPEAIPFFAELMEDGNESVEEACHSAIRKLETILGEDLQKYF